MNAKKISEENMQKQIIDKRLEENMRNRKFLCLIGVLEEKRRNWTDAKF